MKRSTWIAVSLSAAFALVLSVCLTRSASAQDTPSAAPARPAKADGAAKEKGGVDEDDNRLPALYGKVVAPYQKDKVYAIQEKYEGQIAALQQQIKDLLKKRDAEIEAILLPEQREVLARLKEEAKQKAKAVGAKKADAPAATAEAAAPAAAAKPAAP